VFVLMLFTIWGGWGWSPFGTISAERPAPAFDSDSPSCWRGHPMLPLCEWGERRYMDGKATIAHTVRLAYYRHSLHTQPRESITTIKSRSRQNRWPTSGMYGPG